MSRPAILYVEAFHLVMLRMMEARLDRSCFVVKGGVNLRAWFGSARFSEDMDLDVVDLDVHGLIEDLDRLLASSAFLTLLRTQELTLRRISKPKQTETTQRWKFELLPDGTDVPLRTKVEFSRRGVSDPFRLEPVRADVVSAHGIPAPTVNHYTAAAAIRQKIGALVGRKETQVRDIWDLEHLFRTTREDPRPLPATMAPLLPEAAERVIEMPFDAYKAQVVPFLSPEHQEVFGTETAWDRMREVVLARLLELGA